MGEIPIVRCRDVEGGVGRLLAFCAALVRCVGLWGESPMVCCRNAEGRRLLGLRGTLVRVRRPGESPRPQRGGWVWSFAGILRGAGEVRWSVGESPIVCCRNAEGPPTAETPRDPGEGAPAWGESAAATRRLGLVVCWDSARR